MPKPLVSYSVSITISATNSTSVYAAADQLGSLFVLPKTGRENMGGSVLQSIVVQDVEGQSPEIDFLFFNANANITSSDNAALNLQDSEAQKAIGHVTVSATDYKAYGSGNIGCIKNLGLLIRPAAGLQDCYAIAVLRGTPTFSGSNALTFNFSMLQD